MKSKPTITSFLLPLLSIAFLILGLKLIPIFFKSANNNSELFIKIFVPFFIIFVFVYIVIGEIRTKFITVIFESETIIVKRFFGLKTDRYPKSKITGWKYSLLPSKTGTYEYLYLYKNNKKIIKISEFYHRNYKELKQYIENQYEYLGFEKFSYIDELKEIFI